MIKVPVYERGRGLIHSRDSRPRNIAIGTRSSNERGGVR